MQNRGAARVASLQSKTLPFNAERKVEGDPEPSSQGKQSKYIWSGYSVFRIREKAQPRKQHISSVIYTKDIFATLAERFFLYRNILTEDKSLITSKPTQPVVKKKKKKPTFEIMLKFAGTNILLLIFAVNLASEGAYAAPLPKWSMPKIGGSSKPAGTPPKTTDANGDPVSFTDFDSLLDVPVKSSSGTGSSVAKGATVGAGAAAVIGGGVGGGVAATQNPGLGYDYAG